MKCRSNRQVASYGIVIHQVGKFCVLNVGSFCGRAWWFHWLQIRACGMRFWPMKRFRSLGVHFEQQLMVCCISIISHPLTLLEVYLHSIMFSAWKTSGFKQLCDNLLMILQHTGVSYEANGEGIASNDADDYINIFACFYWSTKKAFKQFVATLQDLIRGIFDATDKKVFAGEEGDFIERTIKSCMMLAMIVLSIVVFKRSAAQDTCHIRR